MSVDIDDIVAKCRDAKEKKRVRDAMRVERDRIRRVVLSTLGALRTRRADEYGAGWNAALDMMRQHCEGGS